MHAPLQAYLKTRLEGSSGRERLNNQTRLWDVQLMHVPNTRFQNRLNCSGIPGRRTPPSGF